MSSKSFASFGTPEGIRTPDLLVRSQTLYPAELPAHMPLLGTYLSYHKKIVMSSDFGKKIENSLYF